MQHFISNNLVHVIAALIFVARLGDIGTTYLNSPELKLEQNPIAKKFGWPFAFVTLLLFLIPYYSIPLGIIILVVSLLVSVSNSLRTWIIRTIGETAFHEMIIKTAAEAHFSRSLLLLMLPGLFVTLLALTLLLFYPNPDKDWGFWFAGGIFSYALVLFLHPPIAFLRFRREGLLRKSNEK